MDLGDGTPRPRGLRVPGRNLMAGELPCDGEPAASVPALSANTQRRKDRRPEDALGVAIRLGELPCLGGVLTRMCLLTLEKVFSHSH